TYENNGDEVATDSFTYRFEDANNFSETVTVTFTINNVNDLPEGGDVSLEVVENVGYSFDPSDFTFNDVDAGDSFNGIQITQLPSAGTLTYNGNPVQNNDFIDDVTLLVYTTTENEYGDDYASFGFKVKDQSDAVSNDAYTLSLDALRDTDGDGTPDRDDDDIDGDGTPNDEDDFPYDPEEDTDTDGDGTGDNADPDIDGDGTPNDEDDFPYDPEEDTDTDDRRVGDDAGTDMYGDGDSNDEEDCPHDHRTHTAR